VTAIPPLFAPSFFNAGTGGEWSAPVVAPLGVTELASIAARDPDWVIETAGHRRLRLSALTSDEEGATLRFESLGVGGLITLRADPSGWVRITATIDGQTVFDGFADQPWEEYEIHPPGSARRDAEGEDAPGRIGKRRNRLSLSARAWPQLAVLANEAGWVLATPAEG
jgi:hypothetical protein